jgi:hypothetical protein
MMQYRLSTLFLIMFFVAATIALFGKLGIFVAGVLFLVALCLNRARRLVNGIVLSGILILSAIFCPGLLESSISTLPRATYQCVRCNDNLKQLGIALLNYHDSQKHFPLVYTCDKVGKPLFSWVVPLLLCHLQYSSLYNELKIDEPWNNPSNEKVFSQFPVQLFQCPSAADKGDVAATNYMAIIGPGTIWRKEGIVKLPDLPDGGSHTVALVEVVDSGENWAEPSALTVEEVLESMKTGKGVRISSCHIGGVNVLFANGEVHCLPSKMPLSLWRKILAGEVPAKDLDYLEFQVDPNAPDMVDAYVGTPKTRPWIIILGGMVWLSSVLLLFHRAVKSRKKPEVETIISPPSQAS